MEKNSHEEEWRRGLKAMLEASTLTQAELARRAETNRPNVNMVLKEGATRPLGFKLASPPGRGNGVGSCTQHLCSP